MKALFAHDHRFIAAEGQVWSESQFEAALWARYLGHFQTMTVVGRVGGMPKGKVVGDLELSSALGVDFSLFPNLSSFRGLTIDRAAALQRMRKLVARHDAVIARLPSEIGLQAIVAARSLGKPWAVEVVGCPWDAFCHYGSLKGKLFAPLARFRMRRAVARADHALYVTRSYLQRKYPSVAGNTCAVSNVVLRDASEATLTARMVRIASIGNRPLRLGLISTLRGRFKGIQTVLAALALARSAVLPLHLYVIGGGDPAPWRAEASRLGVGDLVTFEGTLPAGAAVLNWLDHVDIYLQPSFQEGLPRALIEAMSRACPALASTAGGIPELLHLEDLIHPGDSEALAALIIHRINDREWMSVRARRNWEEARGYRADVLEVQRKRFWEEFRRDVEARQLLPPA